MHIFSASVFFEIKEITPGKKGRTAKIVRGGILLHQLFKRWLGIMADRCEVPKLDLKQTIKAARILAQLNRPPLVVEHLRRKAPSAALDNQSWNSFMLNAPYEPDEDNRFSEFEEPEKGNLTPSSESGSSELDEEAVTRAQDVLERARAEILALPAKPTEEQRLAAARNLLRTGAELPLLGLADGDRAMKGNNRAALVYLAYRLYEDQAGKETLKSEWGRCSEVILEILAGNCLAGLSSDDLAGLAGGYIRNQDPGRPQQNAAGFIRRFIKVIRKQAKSICEPGLSVAAMNANSPELRADWVEKARRILTPGQAENLLGEAVTSEEREAFLIFIALGYYCGLREGEILALKGSNYQRGLNHELHLTKSKTRNGLRTIPFDVLTPGHLRSELIALITSHATAAPDELLVPDGASLMARFERLLFKQFRISSHMLRHSMATVLSLKLFLAYNLINPDVVHPGLESLRRQMEFLHGEQFSRESLFELCRNLLGPAWRFTRHHIVPVVSKLMGHGEPTVTLEVYLHSPDFIAAFTCESGHQAFLSQKKAALFLGMDRKTLREKADSPPEDGYSIKALCQVAVSHYVRNPQLRADLADWTWDF